MKLKVWISVIILSLILIFSGIWVFNKFYAKPDYVIGQAIDSLNGIKVYYNGGTGNVSGRNLSDDNYNIGLKYQCVEFVKRYYYEYFNHKMPDSYGHAVDFFDPKIKDGEKNKRRDLTQYTNPSKTKPEVNDLLIYSGTVSNKYGHVAIVSEVKDDEIEIIQQNPGARVSSRKTFSISQKDGKWQIENKRILGWLRKE